MAQFTQSYFENLATSRARLLGISLPHLLDRIISSQESDLQPPDVFLSNQSLNLATLCGIAIELQRMGFNVFLNQAFTQDQRTAGKVVDIEKQFKLSKSFLHAFLEHEDPVFESYWILGFKNKVNGKCLLLPIAGSISPQKKRSNSSLATYPYLIKNEQYTGQEMLRVQLKNGDQESFTDWLFNK